MQSKCNSVDSREYQHVDTTGKRPKTIYKLMFISAGNFLLADLNLCHFVSLFIAGL